MSIVEVYETADSLRRLKTNEALKINVVRCLVTGTVPTRQREFHAGVVFTAVGVLRFGAESDAQVDENRVRINFYDQWAHGASFMEKGDVVILKGFAIVEATGLPGCVSPKDAACHETRLVALPSDSSLRVLQLEEHGDTMEITVTPDNFEAPCVRVLPRVDTSNRVFVNDVKKSTASVHC